MVMFALVAGLMAGATWVARTGLPQNSPPITLTLADTKPAELDASTVDRVLQLLDEDYIKPLDYQKLFQGAMKGLRATLKSKKIDSKTIADLPKTETDKKKLLAEFEARLKSAEELAKGKLTRQKLLYGSLRGLTVALDDPYCVVLDPQEHKHFEEQMSGGNFGGIGIYIELDPEHKNRLTVVEPIEGTPAFLAGVLPGDFIAKIDGKPTKGMDIETAASHIRGPEGSTVHLTLERKGNEKPFVLPVKRALIHVRSVSSKLLDGNIAYLKVRLFGEDTATEFQEELDKMVAKGAKGLIVDLRNNGGGYIKAALDICSHFVAKDKLVVSVVNSRNERNDTHLSHGTHPVKMPMVLLVNRFSASASEITAGALKDHKIATLVGETTFGKASVQQIHDLKDGGALKYTVAHYLTPSGRDIHRKGIEVDIKVKAPKTVAEAKADEALKVAKAELVKKLP